MLTAKYQSFLGPDALVLIQVLESTQDESLREEAITALAQKRDENLARTLIEAWESIPWRQTKMTLLRALGTHGNERSVEFLIRFIVNSDDLPMVAEAVLALGTSQSPIAEHFLLDLLHKGDFPMRKEVILALMALEYSSCEEEVEHILDTPDSAPSLLQFALLAYGHMASPGRAERLQRYLDHTDPIISNAALLALGRGGDQSTLDLLSQRNTRFRMFATELRLYALDHLRGRLLLSIEDALSALITAKTPEEHRSVLRLLQEFPRQEAWDAVMLFQGELKPELETILRTSLFLAQRSAEDRSFILASKNTVPWDHLARLVRRHTRASSGVFILELMKDLSPEENLALLSRVACNEFGEKLRTILQDSKISLIMPAINVLIAQTLMKFSDKKVRSSSSKQLSQLYLLYSNNEAKARTLRAIGQTGEVSTASAEWFAGLLEKEPNLTGSIYAALSLLAPAFAEKVITKRLTKITSDVKTYAGEIERALATLADLGALRDGKILSSLAGFANVNTRISLLRILGTNSSPGFDKLILDALNSDIYRECLLAIAAAKLNGKAMHRERLFALLDSNNPSLAGRSLDTLCIGGSLAEHRRLLNWLEGQVEHKTVVLKVLRSLTPKGKVSYESIRKMIDAFVTAKAGCFADAEVLTAALNLRDNLWTESATNSNKTGLGTHKLDARIRETLAPFDSYADTIKAVLRNAELTWHNPELFDELVDKSTMVVEYTKSIDLFLQEKIGSRIFLETRGGLLQEMHSRIIQFELDEPYLNAHEVLQKLDCASHFSEQAFPLHKLSLICQSICTGKIVRDQYRMVDGLRAWCILFILFGRNFRFRNTDVKAIFPLTQADNEPIKKIAQLLNDLQEVRNRAAHRGILFDKAELQNIRYESLRLLGALKTFFSK